MRAISSMEKRAIMQSANPVLPVVGFLEAQLLPPGQAIVAFFSRVAVAPPPIERVPLDDALGRVLAEPAVADGDYPAAPRALMDGFAVCARATPGEFAIVGDVRMGHNPQAVITAETASRIPTGGVLPEGADAVVPIEDARAIENELVVDAPIAPGTNVAQRGADMQRGEVVIPSASADSQRRRRRSRDARPNGSSGIPAPHRRRVLQRRRARRSKRQPIALANPRFQPSRRCRVASRDGSDAATLSALARRGRSVRIVAGAGARGVRCGRRDGRIVGRRTRRLPDAVAAVADPGILVHGLRVKPGKPTLLGRRQEADSGPSG